MGTIFVGGVHGVGKTEACKKIAAEISTSHFSASVMIKELDSTAVKSHTKSIDDVLKNQQLLIHAVNAFFKDGDARLILDGHFAVPNAKSVFELIPPTIFSELRLDGIIVLFDEPEQIRLRRLGRDRNTLTVDEIAHIQRQEISQARLVARTLFRPIVEIKAFDLAALSRSIRKIWH